LIGFRQYDHVNLIAYCHGEYEHHNTLYELVIYVSLI
jgi:hypothetical protein